MSPHPPGRFGGWAKARLGGPSSVIARYSRTQVSGHTLAFLIFSLEEPAASTRSSSTDADSSVGS